MRISKRGIEEGIDSITDLANWLVQAKVLRYVVSVSSRLQRVKRVSLVRRDRENPRPNSL